MKSKESKKSNEGGRCPNFSDGRPCRTCEYASTPSYDPACLYGHPEAMERKRAKQEASDF